MRDLDEPPGEDRASRGVGDLDRPGGDDQAVRGAGEHDVAVGHQDRPFDVDGLEHGRCEGRPRPVGGRRARRHVKPAIEVAPPSGGDGAGVGSGRYVTEPHGHADALVAGRPADLPQDGHDRAGEARVGLTRPTPLRRGGSPPHAVHERGQPDGRTGRRRGQQLGAGGVAANAGRGLSPRESNARNSGAEASNPVARPRPTSPGMPNPRKRAARGPGRGPEVVFPPAGEGCFAPCPGMSGPPRRAAPGSSGTRRSRGRTEDYP